jgi:lipid A 3-O-deacylase
LRKSWRAVGWRQFIRGLGKQKVLRDAATIGLSLLLAIGAPAAGFAADIAPAPASDAAPVSSQFPPMWGWEVRGGLLVHDPLSPERGSLDVNGEILAPVIFEASNPFWTQFIPHPDLGVSINTVGKTSNLYGGAAWNFDLPYRFFLGANFGVGVNDGKTGNSPPPGWNEIGCNWWFHESASVGYRVTPAWTLMVTVEHSSNAGFCSENRGLTNAGLRVGYQF